MESDRIEAELTFAVDTGVKPVSESLVPGGPLIERTGSFETRKVAIGDGRALAPDLALDREGFELVAHPTAVADFHDAEALERIYYLEIERLVRERTGAARVHIFDHTLRSGDEAERETRKLREPVRVAHNDYTERSGPQRLRDLLPEEADRLLERRFAIVQVWRPTGRPIERDPLALCDASSVLPESLIAAERRHPGRVGEIYQLAYDPGQRWVYFPHLRRDEAILFKVFDSARDGHARFVPHASFEHPDTPADAPPRQSIEVRTIALF